MISRIGKVNLLKFAYIGSEVWQRPRFKIRLRKFVKHIQTIYQQLPTKLRVSRQFCREYQINCLNVFCLFYVISSYRVKKISVGTKIIHSRYHYFLHLPCQ